MIPRSSWRLFAALLLPAAGALAVVSTWAFAADDAAAQARAALNELEAKRAAPALRGAGGALAKGDAGGGASPTRATVAGATAATPLVAAEPWIAEARKALARGDQLRAGGDTVRAQLADELAVEWALTARDAVRAQETEQEVDEEATLAREAVSKAARARALLEEAIARRGKLQAQLDELDQELVARPLDAGPPAKKKGEKKPEKKPETKGPEAKPAAKATARKAGAP